LKRQSKNWRDRASKAYNERGEEIVLRIGEFAMTRQEMIENLGCADFGPARRLTRVLAKFEGKSMAYIANKIDIGDIRSNNIVSAGEVTMGVWFDVLNYHGVDVNAWIDKWISGAGDSIPTICRKTAPRQRRRKRNGKVRTIRVA
jgi:hypothetical protein